MLISGGPQGGNQGRRRGNEIPDGDPVSHLLGGGQDPQPGDERGWTTESEELEGEDRAGEGGVMRSGIAQNDAVTSKFLSLPLKYRRAREIF